MGGGGCPGYRVRVGVGLLQEGLLFSLFLWSFFCRPFSDWAYSIVLLIKMTFLRKFISNVIQKRIIF